VIALHGSAATEAVFVMGFSTLGAPSVGREPAEEADGAGEAVIALLESNHCNLRSSPRIRR
jgi:hypothetical protein